MQKQEAILDVHKTYNCVCLRYVIVHQTLQQHFLWQLSMGAQVKYNWKGLQSRHCYRQSFVSIIPSRYMGFFDSTCIVLCCHWGISVDLSLLTRVILAIWKLLII